MECLFLFNLAPCMYVGVRFIDIFRLSLLPPPPLPLWLLPTLRFPTKSNVVFRLSSIWNMINCEQYCISQLWEQYRVAYYVGWGTSPMLIVMVLCSVSSCFCSALSLSLSLCLCAFHWRASAIVLLFLAGVAFRTRFRIQTKTPFEYSIHTHVVVILCTWYSKRSSNK